jgi:hypothetical protein
MSEPESLHEDAGYMKAIHECINLLRSHSTGCYERSIALGMTSHSWDLCFIAFAFKEAADELEKYFVPKNRI